MSINKSLGTLSATLLVIITVILAPGTWAQTKYQTLHRFTGGDGATPYAGLVLDPAGNLYGTSTAGGGSGWGTVFKMTPKAGRSWTESVLYSFTGGADGNFPAANVILDAAGNLYGTTVNGGEFESGTVFKLAPNPDGSWTERVLYNFCSLKNCADGAFPIAGLIFDGSGNLYSTTSYGGLSILGGTVFRLAPNPDGSWTESVLYNFCSLKNCADGTQPRGGASLVFDGAGNLYGMTPGGGGGTNCSGGCGTVFKLTPNSDGSWTESVLHSFTGGDDGGQPIAGLVFDPSGNLYGTTNAGGHHSCHCGTVFRLTPNSDGSWTESVLHAFANRPATDPDATPIFDASGNLYGTAAFGGPAEGGAVFKLAPQLDGSWAYSVLHVFVGKPALGPLGGLILDEAGNVYGMTEQCGSGCQGVVFEIIR